MSVDIYKSYTETTLYRGQAMDAAILTNYKEKICLNSQRSSFMKH